VDLRDRYGLTQAVFHEDIDPAVHNRAQLVRPEYVIAAEGEVKLRGANSINPNLATGEIELVASRIWILNESRTPPFPMEEQVDVAEEVRLKYRYVDLRRPRMQRNIILRSQISFAVRESLYAQGFLEIETPFMGRSSPEGARDYLVPCRVNPGTFYALPQSPQIFKQLLMVSGFEKYFQIVRCFRDEDFRADRQAEFTQIDLEMSFPQQERIFETIEPLVQRVCEVAGYRVPTPFQRMTYAEAMRHYGSDKPDRRIPPMHPVGDLAPELVNAELPLVAIHIPATGPASRKERDELKAFGQERGLRVYDDFKRLERDYPAAMAQVRERCGAAENDLLLLAAWAESRKATAPRRPSTRLAASCGFSAPRSSTTGTSCSIRGIFNSCG